MLPKVLKQMNYTVLGILSHLYKKVLLNIDINSIVDCSTGRQKTGFCSFKWKRINESVFP